MLDVVNAGFKVSPQVTPCVFVDDLAADTQSEDADEAKTSLSNFLLGVCSRLTADGLEASASKSVVTARHLERALLIISATLAPSTPRG